MPQITLENGEKITISQEKYKELVKPAAPWRASIGEHYCYVNGFGVHYWTENNDECDNYHWEIGNYFRTVAEAEAYRERQLAIGRVKRAVQKANESWEPDWSDFNQHKYEICYDHEIKEFGCNLWTCSEPHSPFLMRNEDAVKNIIENHENDLKLIWGVK